MKPAYNRTSTRMLELLSVSRQLSMHTCGTACSRGHGVAAAASHRAKISTCRHCCLESGTRSESELREERLAFCPWWKPPGLCFPRHGACSQSLDNVAMTVGCCCYRAAAHFSKESFWIDAAVSGFVARCHYPVLPCAKRKGRYCPSLEDGGVNGAVARCRDHLRPVFRGRWFCQLFWKYLGKMLVAAAVSITCGSRVYHCLSTYML